MGMGILPKQWCWAESIVGSVSPVALIKETVEALRGNPLVLGLLLMNMLFAGAGLFYLRTEQRQMDRMIELVADCGKKS
jgi:hypothetical protein